MCFNLISIANQLTSAVSAYNLSAIRSGQPTHLEQEVRIVENALYWGLGTVKGSLKDLVESVGQVGWDANNPEVLSVQRTRSNAVRFLEIYGEVDEKKLCEAYHEENRQHTFLCWLHSLDGRCGVRSGG